ncbi:SAM-dependent MidA family methyltransferase [Knoellia remsis]|uniref:SAM-dependent MidA family methyltransferase n=1 Tax=Knoellia remsis TaxID=407159 RepID=A0A2T0UN50_9MICO|nr:SAM-dependent MidA family methyltransferase [Knoellia remsis]
MRTWREAWQDALYGPGGFYRRGEGPAGHFTTSTHGPLGVVLAEVVARLAEEAGVCRVVDVACGRGELLGHLHEQRPDLELLGVDVVDRPAQLAADIDWLRSPGGPDLPDELRDLDALVLAHEWLDVVPCTVAQVDDHGTLREVLVDDDGHEQLGDEVTGADRNWADAWWPAATPGDRVEVGRQRDDAWRNLLSRNRTGVTIAADYGHTKVSRPAHGTLTAYRQGMVTDPRPDGTTDLTAHVAMDSLGADEVVTQRELVHRLGLAAATPDHARATTDPLGYVADFSRASTLHALTDGRGLGGFHWAINRH